MNLGNKNDTSHLTHAPAQPQDLHRATLHLLTLLDSQELEHDLLRKGIETLTSLIGARYGAIALVDEAGNNFQFVHTGIPPEQAEQIGQPPQGHGLLGAVVRTGETLRLTDFGRDPRSVGLPPNHPPMKSLLAVPIVRAEHTYGRVYLSEKADGTPFSDDDYTLTRHYADALAFTLAYHRTQAEREREKEILQQVAQAIASVTGGEFFRELVVQLAQTLEMDHAFVGELTENGEAVQTVATCARGKMVDNFVYRLAGTPCANVVGNNACFHASGVRQMFPEDRMLADIGAESYIGSSLSDSSGKPLGILVIVDSKPLANPERAEVILRICAARAAAELERQHASRALRESERNLRAIAENADEGIMVTLDGKHVFVNQRLEEMLGYQPGALLNTATEDIVHPDEAPQIVQRSRKRVAGHAEPKQYETIFANKSGQRVFVELSATTTTWQGQPAALVFVRDITERKRAQAQMRQLSSAIEQTADSVIITNHEGVIEYVNPAYQQTTGFSREETVGQTPRIIKSGKHEPAFYQRLWQTILNGQTFREVFINRRKNGELYHEQKTITPLKDEQGRITHFVSTGKDITQRIKDEQALQESQRSYRAMAEVSPVGIYRTDAQGRCLYVNERWCALAGLTPEQAAGTGWSRALYPEDRERVFALWHEMVNQGLPFRAEYRFQRPDGSISWLFGQGAAESDASGNVIGYVGSITDISERKQAEKTLRENNEILERIFDSTHFCVVYLDREFNFIRVNQAYAKACGFPSEYFSGKNHFHLYPHEENQAIFRRVRQTGEPFTIAAKPFEYPDHPEWGVTYWDWTLHPLKDSQGNVEALLLVLLNVTERVRAMQKISFQASLLDQVHSAVIATDDNSRITYWNKHAETLYQWKAEEVLGKSIYEVTVPRISRKLAEQIMTKLQATGSWDGEYEVCRKDGGTFQAHVTLGEVTDDRGLTLGYIGLSEDITERKKAQEALRESEAGLAAAQRIAHIGNWERNLVTNEIHWSDETYRIFGLVPQQPHISFQTFLNLIHPDDRQSVMANVSKATDEKQHYSTEYRLIRPDGTERIVQAQAEIVPGNDGKPDRIIGTIQDITEQRQTQERLNYLAHYDTLTGLPNRVLLQDRLSQAMVEADRRDRLVALMFLDLDRFKIINDTLGHDVGDALLKSVAERLKSCVRAGDTISRLGGDEFTVVLANVAHVDDVAHVAQKIIESFVSPFHIDGRELFVSPSMGITLYPFDDNDIESLLRNADAAMYHAKELGRNTFQFYTAELNRRTAKRLQLETALRHALERDELLLHYQPQVCLKTGRIIGAEALLRWRHPEMGLISPLEFIPLAEETGLIIPIGEWVLRSTCTQARTWYESGFGDLQIAVNLSGRQFQHQHLARLVKKVLKETGLNPRQLDLELTESLLMHNTDAILGAMEELHVHGVAFSMDDFGTGYSSLSYLKRFPIDTLKIDQSFVRDIPRDPDDAAIAQAIIAMAHNLDIRVIAEGVETAKQLAFLRSKRCDGMQGYYFSKPIPAEAMIRLLQKNRRLKGTPDTAHLRSRGSKRRQAATAKKHARRKTR